MKEMDDAPFLSLAASRICVGDHPKAVARGKECQRDLFQLHRTLQFLGSVVGRGLSDNTQIA
jgi:hypothetical protein